MKIRGKERPTFAIVISNYKTDETFWLVYRHGFKRVLTRQLALGQIKKAIVQLNEESGTMLDPQFDLVPIPGMEVSMKQFEEFKDEFLSEPFNVRINEILAKESEMKQVPKVGRIMRCNG